VEGVLVDSSVILDVFLDDPRWGGWGEDTLSRLSFVKALYINPIIYAEVSIGFEGIEELEEALLGCGFLMREIPKEALFLAGKAFLTYKHLKGKKLFPLPDFFIGAHAAIEHLELVTRDVKRIKTYFPTVNVASPYP
jgi:hypothetical protein